MWIRRHWPKFAGYALLAWTVSARVLGAAGSVDLVISRAQDPAWVGIVIGFLLSPPAWLDLLLIGGGLGLIWWDTRWRRPASVTTPAVSSPATSPPAPVASAPKPAPPPPKLEPSTAKADVPKPAAVRLDTEAISKSLPGWDKLYQVTQSGAISLRFLPDTKKNLGDALCLILLAHKLLYGRDKVAVSIIEDQLRQSMRNKPKSGIETAFGLQAIAIEFATNLGAEAVDSGKVERIELAKGGSYTFTWWGEAEALATAQDMIRRA